VDVTLFVDEPASYLDDTAWIGHFGEPLLSFREPTAVGGFAPRQSSTARSRTTSPHATS